MKRSVAVFCVFAAMLASPAFADEDDQPAASAWAARGDLTFVAQGHPSFRSPYVGPNNLTASGEAKQTWSTTLYLGRKLWEGGELWANPELDQGFGLSNTLGLAGFSSGEAERAGTAYPKLHLHRIFFRLTFGLGGGQESVEGDENQFAGKRDISRVSRVGGLSP